MPPPPPSSRLLALPLARRPPPPLRRLLQIHAHLLAAGLLRDFSSLLAAAYALSTTATATGRPHLAALPAPPRARAPLLAPGLRLQRRHPSTLPLRRRRPPWPRRRPPLPPALPRPPPLRDRAPRPPHVPVPAQGLRAPAGVGIRRRGPLARPPPRPRLRRLRGERGHALPIDPRAHGGRTQAVRPKSCEGLGVVEHADRRVRAAGNPAEALELFWRMVAEDAVVRA
ncbi:hypothetical protein EE612_051263 [Oryza sativa]|nr:hypothetical protein EE612_051263 [Oryza sativa]